MARPVSSLESHPQRQKIIDAIIAGTTLRLIAAQADPPISIASISRFKTNVTRNTQAVVAKAKSAIALKDMGIDADSALAVTRAALVAATDPFLLAAQKQGDRRGRWMREIEDAGDYTDSGPDYATLAKLDRNDQTGLELHARLAGRLDQPGANQTNIMIVCPAGQQAPAVTLEPDAVVIDTGARK